MGFEKIFLCLFILWIRSAHSTSSGPNAIVMEGGGLANITTNTSAAVPSPAPATVHSSVRKRVLEDLTTNSHAPVVEIGPPAINGTSSSNATTAKNVPSASLDKPLPAANLTSTTTSAPKLVNASSSSNLAPASVKLSSTETPPPKGEKKEEIKESLVNKTTTTATTPSTSSSTTSTTTSTTTTTTTTQKPKPKKPTITEALNDDPSVVHIPSSPKDRPYPSVPHNSNSLDVEEPVAQLSREKLYDENNHRTRNTRRDLIIPVVSLIFTIPMLLGLITVVARRFRDYWHTRHYRRMDFLVDGIYND